MQKFYSILFLLAFLGITLPVVAQQDTLPPPRISIQGTLKDANGVAVPDGDIQVTFDLYGQPTGGDSKWEEEAVVNVSGGIYSHYLGSENPLDASVFDSTLFLQVTVGNFALSPRTELTYAPYTFAANSALIAVQVECSGALGDIKYSILAPDDFARVNGDCWVPMDGRNIIGSRFSEMFNQFEVPDASGLFIRAHEFAGGEDNDPGRTPASPVGVKQDDTNKAHTHSMEDAGEHQHSYTDWFDQDANITPLFSARGVADDTEENGDDADMRRRFRTTSTQLAGLHSHAINSAGGDESRPRNMSFYVYIRVD